MSNNWPKISIITPVKNSKETVEQSILSVVNQNYPNLEYIVIDGESSDGTIDVIKKYLDHISCFVSKKDRSAISAQLHGISKASGEIIGILNADDYYEPGILFKVAQEFINDSSIDIASCRFRTIRGNSVMEEASATDISLQKNKIITAIGINARFFKKSLFEKYGVQLDEDGLGRPFISNDLEYMIRILLKGVKEKIIDHIGYNYTIHDNSLTFSKNISTKIRLFEDRIYIAQKFLNSSEFDLPKIWQKTFKKWIKKYRSMLVVANLSQLQTREASKNFLSGIRESGFFQFSFYFIKTLIRSRKEKEVGF